MTGFVGYVNEAGEEIRFRQKLPCYCDDDEQTTPCLDGRDIFVDSVTVD